MTRAGAACRSSSRRRAAGAAIVLAMLLAALAATIAATLFADQQRWTRAVLHRRDQVQAQALAMAGVQWARQILFDDARTTTIDHLREPWAIALPPIPLENGEIRGSIADAQARLNINGLGADATAGEFERARIARLLARFGNLDAAQDAIEDWIDIDSVTRPNGAEDAFYAEQSVPGLAANAAVVRVAELALVRGVTLPALAAAAPFLTALPPGTPVNVNSAPPEVLASFIDGISGEDLAALVASRNQKPFAAIGEFRNRLPAGATLANESLLGVKSDFFYISVEARQGTTVARARALLRRGATGNAGNAGSRWPAIVWQIVE